MNVRIPALESTETLVFQLEDKTGAHLIAALQKTVGSVAADLEPWLLSRSEDRSRRARAPRVGIQSVGTAY